MGLDLSDLNEVRQFAADLPNHATDLKYLVNAAGYFSPKSFLEHSEKDYDTNHGFNKAFFLITQAAAKIMDSNQGGSIVNIGSMWAHQAIKATPFICLLNGQGGTPQPDPAPGHGTCE